jgi:hypothetical protein
MGPGDLPRRDLVVVADVGRRVATTVLELDPEPHAELLHVERQTVPIDSDGLTDRARLIC